MDPLVIYNADCADGFCAAFVAWTMLGDEAEYVPMKYGDILEPARYLNREVYILDFSFLRETMDGIFEMANHVTWLDHHKTAFEMWFDGLDESTLPKNAIQMQCSDTKANENNVSAVHRSTNKIKVRFHYNKSGALLAWEYFHPGEEVPMLIQHIDEIIIKEE